MKKLLSVILALTMLCGCLALTVSADDGESTASQTDILKSLVVAYDFEGNDAATQLADKATRGIVRDNLTIEDKNEDADVSIENGVATVPAGNTTRLYSAANSKDLTSITGYTVYMKVKATGEATTSYADVINMPGLFRMYTTAKADGGYTIAAHTNKGGGSNIGFGLPSTYSFDSTGWFYVAATVSLDNGYIIRNTYTSNDGATYAASNVSKTANTSTELSITSNINLAFSSQGMVYSFDDVMIFDRALTAGEIAELASVKTSQDRVGYIGFQTANKTDSAYDIRFVSVIDSTEYDAVGYDIVVKKGETELAATSYSCQNVYLKINEMNYERTAAQLGGQYIFAVGIKGFDVLADGVVFEITPYYWANGVKNSLTTVRVTNAHLGAAAVSEYVY